MQIKRGTTILFLCDRKACGEVCPFELCTHTGDISHSKNFKYCGNYKLKDFLSNGNFERLELSDKQIDYYEV